MAEQFPGDQTWTLQFLMREQYHSFVMTRICHVLHQLAADRQNFRNGTALIGRHNAHKLGLSTSTSGRNFIPLSVSPTWCMLRRVHHNLEPLWGSYRLHSAATTRDVDPARPPSHQDLPSFRHAPSLLKRPPLWRLTAQSTYQRFTNRRKYGILRHRPGCRWPDLPLY